MNHEKIQDFLRELPRMQEDLPYSPKLLKELFVQTGSNSIASMEAIGDTLSKDQGLTTRILSLANSAYYGLQAEVKSVQRAAAVLGMGEVRNIVLALGVNGLTAHYDLPKDFDLVEYWTHQFFVGMIAKELSRMCDVGKPDDMFTVGLLHDVGNLITAMRRPEDWEAINDSRDDDMSLSEAEDAYWGMDHAVIGALVLKSWDLPAVLVEPVNWHHAPELAPEYSSESCLLAMADSAVRSLEFPDLPYGKRLAELCEEMNVELDDVLEIAEELTESDEVEQFVQLMT